MSYTVIITEEIAANVAVTTQNYPITIEYNATNIAAGTTYGDSNVSTLLASFGSNSISTTGNVTAAYFVGDGSQLTGLPGGLYGNADVSAYLATGTNTANIVTAGNVQGAFVKGNGSALSAITGANVTGTVANATFATSAGTATTAGTANVALVANSVAGANVSGAVAQATQAGTANVANSVAGANVTGVVAQATQAATANVANSVAGANVTGVVAQATQANAANTAVTVTGAAQANITSVGTLTGLSVSGNVTAGNLNINADAVITGNLTVNGTTTTINSNVVTVNDKTFVLANNQSTGAGVDGSGIIAGNPAVASILYDNASGTWKTNIGVGVTGNVTATGFSGSGAALTAITGANVTGTVANAAYATSAGSATTAGTANVALSVDGANVTGTVPNATVAATVSGAAQANITSLGTLTGLSATGNITTTANISGAFILGDGSQLTGLPATYGNANVAANLAAFGSNPISTTGNITAGNITGVTVTATQQAIVGTANVGTTGNIIVSGKNIATDVIYSPDGGTAATSSLARVYVGTGLNGNVAHSAGQGRLQTGDSFLRGNTSTQVAQFRSEPFATLSANVTNGQFRQQAVSGILNIGGGAAANTIIVSSGVASPFIASAGQFNVVAGNISPANLGNVTLSHAALNGGAIGCGPGSNITNAFGFYSLINSPGAGSTSGNITNYTGYTTAVIPSVTGNVFMFYNGNATSGSTRSAQVSNGTRAATNYYFLMNEDDVAQVQLGSLRRYHEFETATATSGSFAIDKNQAQVHNIVPTGNCTITGYSNMITSASDSVNTDSQVDTLTIIVEQGATPYTVTLPTGSQYKYAGNVSTVGATANAVTMISVTAANVRGVVTYLTTVSPEFV